jgi:pimeloyl-ACP methyl ester carboxylesterase
LGRFARVIRFDRRDTGVSDPIRDDLTLEAHAADALAVIDAAGSERPVLLGALDGARSLAALAATHPQRVGALIAVLATAKGGAVEAPEIADNAVRSLVDLD